MDSSSILRTWAFFKDKIKHLSDNEFNLDSNDSTNSIRNILSKHLGIENGEIIHPTLGKIKIKIRGQKVNHYNISFSKSPTYLSPWNSKKLLFNFGYSDNQGHKRALRRRISIFDNSPSSLGLVIENGVIFLRSETENIASWSFNELIHRFDERCKIIVIDYDLNYEDGNEIVTFTDPRFVFINRSILESTFEEMIKRGKISPEFRMYIGEDHEHCKTRNISPGSLRDHGFGWRLKAHESDIIYTSKKI